MFMCYSRTRFFIQMYGDDDDDDDDKPSHMDSKGPLTFRYLKIQTQIHNCAIFGSTMYKYLFPRTLFDQWKFVCAFIYIFIQVK